MKIIDFIVCDDIRQEIGNKLTIVGIYNDRIKIEAKDPGAIKFPIPFRLGVFTRILVESTDECSDELSFNLDVKHNSELLFQADGNAKVVGRGDDGSVIVAVPLLANIVPIKGAGHLEFCLTIKAAGKELLKYSPEYDFEIEVVQK